MAKIKSLELIYMSTTKTKAYPNQCEIDNTIKFMWNSQIDRHGGKYGRTENNNTINKQTPLFNNHMQKAIKTLKDNKTKVVLDFATIDLNLYSAIEFKQLICKALNMAYNDEYDYYSHVKQIEKAKTDNSKIDVLSTIVTNALKSGWTEEQIKQKLLKNGYTKEQLTPLFKTMQPNETELTKLEKLFKQ